MQLIAIVVRINDETIRWRISHLHFSLVILLKIAK